MHALMATLTASYIVVIGIFQADLSCKTYIVLLLKVYQLALDER